ncbi:hypothetical protein AAHC03_025859 [Spirometra sp. Aus1]
MLRLELLGAGLEVYEQEFTYSHKLFAGETVTGKNVYAIMRSRSGSHTEALVIMAPLRVPTSSDSVATSYTFITSVAKHIRTQLYWAKDLIFLFPDMDYIGLLAWLDAYHGVRTTKSVIGAELIGRAGSIQAGVNIEFPSLFMDGIDISYQGVNGELPNLDIINTLKRLAAKLRVPVSVHGQIHWSHAWDRLLRLHQLTSSVWVQGSGSPSGLHGILINFQIPTITLRGIPSVHDRKLSLRALEMIGSLLEAFLRCLNNLQERFHQSFYYYLLPGLDRYISIGVFTPPFFVAMAGLALLVLVLYGEMSLKAPTNSTETEKISNQKKGLFVDSVEKQVGSIEGPSVTECDETTVESVRKRRNVESTVPLVPKPPTPFVELEERRGYDLFPEFLFDYISVRADPESAWLLSEYYCFITFMVIFALLIALLPLLAFASKSRWLGHGQDWRLTKCISLLLWCVLFGCLAPLNISTSFLLLLAIQPVLMIVYVCRSRWSRLLAALLMLLVSPPVLLVLAFLLNPLISQFPPPPTENVTSVPIQLGKVLLQTYLEADLLGSWSWNLATRILLPLWLFTWNGLLVSA